MQNVRNTLYQGILRYQLYLLQNYLDDLSALMIYLGVFEIDFLGCNLVQI